jgi:hypothetical protein
VVLKNHKLAEDIVVTVSASPDTSGSWQVTASNYKFTMKNTNTAEFQVPVKAGGEVELMYSYKVVWR